MTRKAPGSGTELHLFFDDLKKGKINISKDLTASNARLFNKLIELGFLEFTQSITPSGIAYLEKQDNNEDQVAVIDALSDIACWKDLIYNGTRTIKENKWTERPLCLIRRTINEKCFIELVVDYFFDSEPTVYSFEKEYDLYKNGDVIGCIKIGIDDALSQSINTQPKLGAAAKKKADNILSCLRLNRIHSHRHCIYAIKNRSYSDIIRDMFFSHEESGIDCQTVIDFHLINCEALIKSLTGIKEVTRDNLTILFTHPLTNVRLLSKLLYYSKQWD